MKSSSILSLILVALIIVVVIVPSVYTVNKRHHNKMKHVAENKIIDTAKRCYYEGVCSSNKVTLEELYNQKKIEKIANPLTYEYYKENSYVLIETDISTFYEID